MKLYSVHIGGIVWKCQDIIAVHGISAVSNTTLRSRLALAVKVPLCMVSQRSNIVRLHSSE